MKKYFLFFKYENISNLFLTIFLFFILFQRYFQALNDKLQTNLIEVGEKNFRYLTFASYSNGDMILSITAYPKNEKRIFYGLKKNGRPFFNNNESYYYSINSNISAINESKYVSDSIVIKLSGNENNGKEYLISSGNKDIEIYDFENNKIYKKPMTTFAENRVESYRNSAISFFSENYEYYYLFSFTINASGYNQFIFQKHKFISLDNFINEKTLIKSNIKDNAYKDSAGISCFQTENKIIICFCLIKQNKNQYHYYIIAYTENLEYKNEISFKIDSTEKNLFYKCIHLKKEIGIFSYYDTLNFNKPNLLLKNYRDNSIKDYSFPTISLNEVTLINNLLANDIIKITDNKICFSGVHTNNITIYII